MEVMNNSKSKDDVNSGHTHSGGKDPEVIEVRSLIIALGHKASLVVIYRAISIVPHLKHQLEPNDSIFFRSLNQVSSIIAFMHS